MNKKKLIEQSRLALAEFDRLPPAEQVRQLIQCGAINEKGEVLFGREQKETQVNPEAPHQTR